MTINIQKASNLTARGIRTNKNRHPVLCITTGEVFASATDAAEANEVSCAAMSWVLTGRTKTCKGKRFCYVANITEHLEEIAECIRIREAKVAAYDAISAKQEAIRKAKENVEKHKAKVEELRQAYDEEVNRLLAAENELEKLKND